jgi:hypothetical protein
MEKVNLPKVEYDIRAGLNMIKALRKDKTLGDTLYYLISLDNAVRYLPIYYKTGIKKEEIEGLDIPTELKDFLKRVIQ